MPDKFAPAQSEEGRGLAGISIALCAGFALALGALYLTIQIAGYPGGSRGLAGDRDFVSYWATGRQLVLHGNPYDRSAISALEHREGLGAATVLIMRNPPWALPFAYPLGFLSLRVAAVVWSALLLICLLVSVRMIRRLYGDPPNRLHWAALSFMPALLCFLMGQTALIALLGITLFLCLNRSRPVAAGAALWFCALKPHLFLAFAAVCGAWILVTRAWKVAAGSAVALAVSSALASLLDPHAWHDYAQLMQSPSVKNDFIPCLTWALRQRIAPQANWLQYFPAALCCIWALVYYWQRRTAWDWKSEGSLLILLSLLTAPYCWIYDQCVAVPALLDGVYSTRSQYVVVALALLIFVADIELCAVRITSLLYLWTAPAWLAWYLTARYAGMPSRSAKV